VNNISTPKDLAPRKTSENAAKTNVSGGAEESKIQESVKIEKFIKFLEEPDVDLTRTRTLCWNAVPASHRYLYWPILLVSISYFFSYTQVDDFIFREFIL
jgi:hypothetical protein